KWETRTFDFDRYRLSIMLPRIMAGIRTKPCHFATSRVSRVTNYVTVDHSCGERYAVFFNLRRWLEGGEGAVLLVVQSAYRLDTEKLDPGRGKITFVTLIAHALKGTIPKRPS